MPTALQEMLNRLKDALGKISRTQQMILAGAVVFLVVILFVVTSVSTDKPMAKLVPDPLTATEFTNIIGILESASIPFSTTGGNTVLIMPEHRHQILQLLAQNDAMPKGAEPWALFDVNDWDETQFDKDIKLQRAIKRALEQSLESITDVKDAVVNLSIPRKRLFDQSTDPVKAGIVLKLKPGYEKLRRKQVKGMITLVQRGVPGLKRENITIVDEEGRMLSDPDDDEGSKEEYLLKIVKLKLQIQDQQRLKKLVDIKETLDKQFPDRNDIVRLDVEFNWDVEKLTKEIYSPIVMKKDDPKTPYDESEVKESLPVSSKTVKEIFEGKGFTPDGPAGTEPNIPPGYKDTEYQKAVYTKLNEIKNHAINKTDASIEKQPWSISKITLAVALDGIWTKIGQKDDGSGWIRKYDDVADATMKKMRNLLGTAIGFDKIRGDMISIETLQKDRSAEHAAEDEELRRQRLIRNILLGATITILVALIIWMAVRAVRREMERRRRRKEEELARRQQMMRDAALRVAEDEGADFELSAEERARREMLENAINLAREKPEDVALLLRTWLAEE